MKLPTASAPSAHASPAVTMPRRLPAWVALAAILLLAGTLRFGFLGRNSFWFDEAWVANVAQLRWPQALFVLTTMEVHPPLYFMLAKAWAALAGTSEIALRIPSAVASLASVFLSYVLLRRIASEPMSLLGTLLIALSPFAVMTAQEARMYAPLEMLVVGSTLAVSICVERGGAARWAGYAVLAAAVAYTHYLGVLVLAAHGLWVGLYARRRLLPWSVAMGAVVLLYAPWISSFWHQAAVTEYHALWRDPLHASSVTSLLGLFAFGGSLFGMPGYFFDGPLDPRLQWLVVLPFLVVLWRGAAGAPNRRGVVLIGLCLVLPVGTALLISLVKPMFYARWFSFLAPFYAMLTAFGMADLAARARARNAAVLVGLSAAVVVAAVPVFGRYYLDPDFRPYQWRAAAALVRAHAHPEDAMIYVPHTAAVAFRYYFHEPHPSLILNPLELTATRTAHPQFTSTQAEKLAARYRRVWLISTFPLDVHMQQRLLAALGAAFEIREAHEFQGVGVARLDAKPPGPSH